MRFYYFIGSVLAPLAIVSLNVYSRIFRTIRTRIVLEDDQGRVLLLRTWLSGNKWSLPGGGVERGELPVSAAKRELREEAGIVILDQDLRLKLTLKAAGHQEMVFTAHTSSELPEQLPNHFEVKDAGWFSLKELPPLEPLARTILDKLAIKD